MKKYVSLLICVLGVSCLLGCSAYKLDLTASEHDKIAEYAAYALLSNAKEYDSKLLEQDKVDKILAERELEDKIKEEMDKLNNQTTRPTLPEPPVIPGETTVPDVTNPTTKPVEPTVYKTIDDILGIKNVSVQYAGFELCKMYPDDPNEFVTVKASKGKQLVVLSFVMQNTSNQKAECDINSRNIINRIHLENGNAYSSMLTAMAFDFSTWNTPLEAGSTNMAFLVFQVPEDLTEKDFDNMELSFRENKKTQGVVLK